MVYPPFWNYVFIGDYTRIPQERGADGNQRRIPAVDAETVYAQYNARYAAIIPCSFKEHGVSDGKQRRISAVNAETVYARYNARYAVIIPYILFF